MITVKDRATPDEMLMKSSSHGSLSTYYALKLPGPSTILPYTDEMSHQTRDQMANAGVALTEVQDSLGASFLSNADKAGFHSALQSLGSPSGR